MSASQSSAKAIFLQALELSTATERAAYVETQCGSNADLRHEVEALLAEHQQLGSFMEAPPAAATLDRSATERPGTQIGPYKILQQIGEGGMGTVFMAEQTKPVQRRVAIKIIKAGMDSRQVLARFAAEKQALALMDHVNIARVLDAGTTGSEPGGVSPGRPYFVMELVHGVPITKYCDDNHLTPRQRLELFVPVCQAIQHAHQKGIIHRDIKPSNVMITLYDGKPVPKVIDFGVAKATEQKLTEQTLFTQYGTMVGTLEYMSPEQAEMSALGIDTRSDIYSLGVLLYELLTGSTPLSRQQMKEAAYLEILRLIRDVEPPKPSTRLSESGGSLASISALRQTEPAKLSKLMRGELDWIVMKTLEKDRNRRYETASGLAADVQRYLADETVQACPPSAMYRFRKMARRNTRALATVTVLIFAVLAVAGTFVWAVRDRVTREAAVQAEVDLALQEAERWRDQARWPEALSAVKRAEGLLAGAEGNKARERSHQLRKELELVVELQSYRAHRANLVEHPTHESGYPRLFANVGIDIEKMSPPEVAAQIARRPATAIAVAGALDDWAQETQNSVTLKRLREAARLADPDPWRNQLRQLIDQKDLEGLQTLAKAAQMSVLPVQSLQLMGNALAFAGDAPACIAWLRRAHRQYPGDSRISFDLAFHLSEQDGQGNSKPVDLVDALRFAEAALASRPSPGMYDFVGNILLQMGRYDEAIACTRKAIEIAPDFNWDRRGLGEAYRNLGVALLAQQKPDEAVPCFRKSIELKPTDWAYKGLGDTFTVQGKLDEAITCYQKAIELNPQWDWPHSNLGDVLAAQGKLDDAIVYYCKAIELDPEWIWARLKLGDALRRKGDAAGAVAAYREAIEIAPDDTNLSELYKNLGEVLATQEQLDEAIVCYLKAIELNPTWGWPRFNLGDVLAAQGKLDEAIVSYHKAIELDPQSCYARLMLGNALLRKGDAAGAVAAYREAIEIAPDYKHWNDKSLSEAYKKLGEALVVQGKLDDAIVSYRKAIELNPEWSWPRLGLVIALNRQAWALATDSDPEKRDPDRAVELAKEAVELAPTDANYWNILGVAQYRAGHWQEAITALQRFRELRTNDGEWSNPLFLAMAHWQLGSKDEARQWYDKGVAWMAKNQHPDDLFRFRAEAAELLAIETKQD